MGSGGSERVREWRKDPKNRAKKQRDERIRRRVDRKASAYLKAHLRTVYDQFTEEAVQEEDHGRI